MSSHNCLSTLGWCEREAGPVRMTRTTNIILCHFNLFYRSPPTWPLAKAGISERVERQGEEVVVDAGGVRMGAAQGPAHDPRSSGWTISALGC